MTKKQIFLVFAGLICMSSILVNCGAYADCVRYYNALYNKQGTCIGPSASEYEKRAKDCESRLEQCSEEDRAKTRETTKCIEQLEVCPNSITHGARLLSCHSRLTGISGACAAAFARP